MHRVDIVAIILSTGLLLVVVELVRRRALSERYSLLWLLTSAVLIGLSLWRGALELVARALGIYYSPSALLLVAMGFILLILLHYSLVISKLTERHKTLAQRHAILASKLDKLERGDERPPTRWPA